MIKMIMKISLFSDHLDRCRRLLFSFLLVGLGSLTLISCSGGQTDESDAPVILLSPNSGTANTQVVVAGENFPAGMAVMLRLGPPDVGATPFSYADGIVGEDGRFTLTFHVPAAWPDGLPINEPTLTVIALNDDGSLKATAPFTLETGAPVAPTEAVLDGVMTPDPDLVANEQAIVNSVMNSLIQSGESTQVAVSVEQIEGDYARVGVVSLQPEDAGAKSLGFLKSVNDVWEVLVIGRDFDAEQLVELGIPTTVLPEEMVIPEG